MAVPISFAESVTAPSGTGTTLVPTIPSHQEDDVLILQAGWKGNQAPTTLTGWTLYFSQATGTATNGCGQGVWWRRVAPSETVTSPTLTIGATAVERRGIVYCIRGADIDNPSNTFWQKQQTVGNSASPTPPGITTLAPNYLLLHMVTCRGNSAVTPPTGYNEEQDSAEGTTICTEGSTKTQTTAASVSGQAATISSNRWVAAILAIPSPDYPYFRSQTSQTATATSITGTLPTGTTATDFYGRKDLILATVEAPGTAPSPNTGADWTSLATWETTTSGGATTVRQYSALYDGSIDLQFNRSGSGEISLNFSTYRNPHQTVPIGNVNVRQNASSTTSTWDALTRSATKSTVIAICIADGVPTYTAPAGWTEREDGFGMSAADQIFEATGSTASASFTLSTASATAVGLVEIKSHAGEAGASEVTASGADTLTQSDALLLGRGLLVADSAANLSDASVRNMGHLAAFTDNANNLADATVITLGQEKTFAEALPVFIDYATACTFFLGLEVECVDTEARIGIGRGDTLNITDDQQLLLEYQLNQADSALFLGEFAQIGWGGLFTDDAANWADDVAFELIGNALSTQQSDTLDNWADAFAGQMAHLSALDDTLTQSDEATLQLGHLVEISDQLILSDTDSEQMAHLLSDSDSLTLTDDFSFQLIGTQIGIAFTDTLSQQDEAVLSLHHALAIADALVQSDAANIAVGVELGLSDSLNNWLDDPTLQFHYHVPVTDTFSLTDALATFGESFLQLSESLLLTDEAAINLIASVPLTAVDTLDNWADGAVLLLEAPNVIGLSVGDSFTLNDHLFSLFGPHIPSTKRRTVVPSVTRGTTPSGSRLTIVPASNRDTHV